LVHGSIPQSKGSHCGATVDACISPIAAGLCVSVMPQARIASSRCVDAPAGTKGISLFVERPERWLIHVETRCGRLDPGGRCST
jgi:hypothetical protein